MRLTLEERTALERQCEQRMVALAQEFGVGVAGVGTRQLVEMLRESLSVEQQANAKERWLFWLAEQLDRTEASAYKQAREAKLTSGVR